MVDLGKLERLDRLRVSGVLTEDEFLQQKAKLLADIDSETSSHNRKWFWWLVFSAVGLIAAAAFFSISHLSPSETEKGRVQSVIQPSISRPALPTIPADDPPVIPQEPSKLAFATSTEVIGVNPAYLEKRLGIPREKSSGYMLFEVEGCTISYWVEQGAVSGFDIDLSRRCQPTIQGNRVTLHTTFAQLQRRESWGSIVASCLYGCGNAADPTISVAYPGSRATQFISITYSANYDRVSEALTQWELSVRQKLGIGEFDIPDDYEAFNCVTGPPPNVMSLLRNVPVQRIHVSNSDRLC